MPVSIHSKPPRRAVVIAGNRTPFQRVFTGLTPLDAVDLGVAAVRGLLERTQLPWKEVDSLVWGGVILPSGAPNVGREIVLDLGLPPEVEAMTVSRACATGLQAVTLAAAAIERGEADVVIAGGGDSTSNAEIKMGKRLVQVLGPVSMNRKAGPLDWLSAVAQLRPLSEVLPRKPEVAERSTGELMGEAAEKMAKRNHIAREDQDAFTVTSHQRAAAAIASGRFNKELTALEIGERSVDRDNIVRADTSVEQLARLKPVFDRKAGTLTAGNASALTDGAASVLLMSEEKARALGLTPLAALRSWSFVGVDPADQLLIGPAIAMPRALERAGLTLGEVDLVDIHEAFAAQVLCVLKALASEGWAKQRLGRDAAVGEVDPARLNVHGGSLALGHPFAATGARMVTTMARELALSDKQTAILGICAAGGLGAAAVLERV
ncbi:MAG: acetyl-CoA C-acyltransferase [Alphaproteobacteria bacterium]|nr:acetyl-CoA C-acyltransferase [Alphaproteobacteria bacterium]